MISRRTIGISLIIISAICLVVYLVFHSQIIHIMENTISPDGEIRADGVRQLDYLVFFIISLGGVLGAGIFKSEDEDWRDRLSQAFFTDPFCNNPNAWFSPKAFLLASTLLGLFLIVHIRLYDPDSRTFAILYLEDGVFESLTPILMLASIVLLSLSIPRLRKDPQINKYRNLLSLVYILLILVFFLNAMEEISWGQRIFGWNTPQSFEGNVQDETNLHNYFNQYYLLFYRLLAFFPIVVFVSIWLEMCQRYLVFKRTVLPHPSLLGLSLLIALVSFVWFEEQELLEELFAVFFLFYSLRIYLCFQSRYKGDGSDKLPTRT